MAEEAAATDLLSGGRLQLGVSRGSPETALHGSEAFGYVPPDGASDADLAREKTALFLAAVRGATVVDADPRMTGGVAGRLAIQPQSPAWPTASGGAPAPARPASGRRSRGMNLMSSTLLVEDTGVPFDQLQAEQIARFRDAWAAAGWDREPRVSVSRSVLPIVTDLDRQYFGGERSDEDQVGILEGVRARFGKSYVGEPDGLAEELAKDAAVREADSLLLTVPNMLGVEYNATCSRTSSETSHRRSAGCTRTSAGRAHADPSAAEQFVEHGPGPRPAVGADLLSPSPLVLRLHRAHGGQDLAAPVGPTHDPGSAVVRVGADVQISAVLERSQRLGERLLGQSARLDHPGQPDAVVRNEGEQAVVPSAQAGKAAVAELVQP